ncbi:molybdopterin-guanine dinucleotide biosynthesis protein B [Hyphomicrobium nitrativorans]|uniref:molybdopterin-guanine dinucleotide biosynthesis protein B n=1 Tax=Hyphomicrobium nitrativorans TaxID=1427356 RepID=UPI00059BDBE6|nr:molybdopterin-guanine dinucleotide biosynthesis protein B [Hyphomicrobium nitrativorans]
MAGWKNSGKTTLVARLVAELVAQGYRVSTVKSSHHDIAAETEGSDSDRHKKAGAHQVALVSPAGWTVIGGQGKLALDPNSAPSLTEIAARLAPVDIVLVEGMKRAPIPKIEVRRKAQGSGAPLAPSDPHVFAIAADHAVEDASVPAFSLDDIARIAQAVLATARIATPETSQS